MSQVVIHPTIVPAGLKTSPIRAAKRLPRNDQITASPVNRQESGEIRDARPAEYINSGKDNNIAEKDIANERSI